jgi:hypothetical protein
MSSEVREQAGEASDKGVTETLRGTSSRLAVFCGEAVR